MLILGVIPTAAVFQAEGGISSSPDVGGGGSLGPLEKTRAFGMTPSTRKNSSKVTLGFTSGDDAPARCAVSGATSEARESVGDEGARGLRGSLAGFLCGKIKDYDNASRRAWGGRKSRSGTATFQLPARQDRR